MGNVRRLTLFTALAAATLTAAILACSSSYGDGAAEADAGVGPSDAGGAEDAGPVVPRTLHVVVDWPSSPSLDPGLDARASGLVVTVRDVLDPSRGATVRPGKGERGPFSITLESSGFVDVEVAVTTIDGRSVGFGARRRFDVRSTSDVPVAVRSALLYATSADRTPGQITVLDPSSIASNDLVERTDVPLDSLHRSTFLAVTGDGKALLQAGAFEDGGSPSLAVFDTGTHARVRTIALPFRVGDCVALGDGNKVVCAPVRLEQHTSLVEIDTVSGQVTLADLKQSNVVEVYTQGAAVSADGRRAAFAVTAEPTRFVLLYDPAAGISTIQPPPGTADLRGVAFTPDGTHLAVGMTSAGTTFFDGKLAIYDLTSPTSAPRILPLPANTTRVQFVVLHPDGKHAYVGVEPDYGAGCCGESRIVDLDTGGTVVVTDGGLLSGPEHQILHAIRLPYPPFRVFGGQTDNGNNTLGSIVDMTDPTQGPKALTPPYPDIGGLTGFATPFAPTY